MAQAHDQALESELRTCALMIDQIKANARVLFGCRYTYDVAIGHGDDGGYRALLFRHDRQQQNHRNGNQRNASTSTSSNSNSNSNSNNNNNGSSAGGNGGGCAPDGPRGTRFQELRRAHALLRLAIAPTRREAVRSVLGWTEELISGGG
ncbi:hypothetical protein DIS24_g6987 [Lasiodiplodia hormozganensis]|uniref:Uncharacterized protein n=1 Tax=Lasiodiplodia hormozganensis TaxID=869390 RepID=A0AA39YDH6_9PEZI|nr:hypothetical protein DIS24_g6987 [Lasiodiplodia hormozganensis]